MGRKPGVAGPDLGDRDRLEVGVDQVFIEDDQHLRQPDVVRIEGCDYGSGLAGYRA